MKENIKNNESQERLTYVPASVQVFEVTAHEAILAASNPNSTEQYEREDW